MGEKIEILIETMKSLVEAFELLTSKQHEGIMGTIDLFGVMNGRLSALEEKIDKKINNSWIPCNEKLPEVGRDVLVFTERNLQRVWQLLDHEEEYVWEDEFGGWNEFEEVIAWQPLPSPYEVVN